MGKRNIIKGIENQFTENKYSSKIIQLVPKNEQEIWSEFLNGDDAALSFIYRQYVNNLYSYGRQFADQVLVQDCIQDLFFDLIRSRKRLGKIKSLKAYLFSSLRRKIVRRLKKVNKEVRETNLDDLAKFRLSVASDGVTPLDNFTKSRLEVLKTACNNLPSKQREAIILYYFEELSYSEIAEIFGMGKVASARILIYRALDSLKKILGNLKEELLIIYLSYLCLS